MNKFCPIWRCNVSYEWVRSHMNESYPIPNESLPIWMSYVSHEWVTFHMNETCLIWMSHVLYEWWDIRMAHLNETWLIQTRHDSRRVQRIHKSTHNTPTRDSLHHDDNGIVTCVCVCACGCLCVRDCVFHHDGNERYCRLRVCMCVCVYVREGERKRTCVKSWPIVDILLHYTTMVMIVSPLCVWMCVCVCVRESVCYTTMLRW